MLYSGTWMFSQILKANPQFEIGWFFLPNDETRPLIELNGDWEWSITASAMENEVLYQTAVDFLEYYYSEDTYIRVLQNMNGISSTVESFGYEAVDAQREVMEEVRRAGRVSGGSIGTAGTPEGFGNQLYWNLLELAEGKQSVRETAERLDKEWRKRAGKN